MNSSRLRGSRDLIKDLDLSAELSGTVSFTAEQLDETDHAAQRCFHRVPLAVGQIIWELLNQRAGPLTSQAEEAQTSIHQLNVEEQVVHSALKEGAGGSVCPEAECHAERGLRVELLCFYVHVTSGLK